MQCHCFHRSLENVTSLLSISILYSISLKMKVGFNIGSVWNIKRRLTRDAVTLQCVLKNKQETGKNGYRRDPGGMQHL